MPFINLSAAMKLTGSAAFIALLFAGNTSAANYTVVELATLEQGSTIVVRGPNGMGVGVGGGRLVGRGPEAKERPGLRMAHGDLQRISGLPGSNYSSVLGINDVGGLVGGSNTATTVRAFLATQGGGTQELPPVAGDAASIAYAINNLGQAVGFSSGPRGQHAVVWSRNRTVTALPDGGSKSSNAYGINERGDVAGVIDSTAGRRAVLWASGGAPQTLALLPGDTTSEAAGINGRGDVVGFSANAAGARHATLWPSGGAPVNLGILPGGNFSQAYGTNNQGDVVGTSASAAGGRAFLWTSAVGLQDLNTLIPPSPFVLTAAMGINNVGMIIAVGNDIEHTDGLEAQHGGSHDGHDHHSHRELPTRVFLLMRSGV
jgi:probable HAF family extracellular repeat protein